MHLPGFTAPGTGHIKGTRTNVDHPFRHVKTVGTSDLWCCESSSPLYSSCKVSGKRRCYVSCLGTSPGEVAWSFLSASQHNCKIVICPEQPTWLPAGCRQGGRVGGSAPGSKGCGSQRESLHPETQRKNTRRKETGYE